MTTQPSTTASPVRFASYRDAEGDLDGLTVPYTGQTEMRLVIASGMADARVHVDPAATDLLTLRYGEGTPPRLRVSASELRLSWPLTFESWLRSMISGEDRDVELVLHPAVEWTLSVRGGLSHLDADLANGKLARLEVSGGVSDARIDLPAPGRVVPVRISGGASNLALRRPADAGVALAVTGGISDLRLDDQRFDAIGGGSRLASGLVHGDAPRYALEISGGASNLHIAARA
jgi:hypothetical protein